MIKLSSNLSSNERKRPFERLCATWWVAANTTVPVLHKLHYNVQIIQWGREAKGGGGGDGDVQRWKVAVGGGRGLGEGALAR